VSVTEMQIATAIQNLASSRWERERERRPGVILQRVFAYTQVCGFSCGWLRYTYIALLLRSTSDTLRKTTPYTRVHLSDVPHSSMGTIGSRTSEEDEKMLESRRGSSALKTTCVLDDQILNRYTIHHMTNLGLSIFADVCGRNRGVFVVNDQQQREPTSAANGDGATYSCLTLPPSFANGLPESVPMATSNDIGTSCVYTQNKREREYVRGDDGSKKVLFSLWALLFLSLLYLFSDLVSFHPLVSFLLHCRLFILLSSRFLSPFRSYSLFSLRLAL
jgi:hypothetical protein